LVPRGSSGLARSGRLPRPLARHLDEIRSEGLSQAARVTAAAHVTRVALHLTATLSTEEGMLVTQCPLGEARYRLLVDNFTAVAAYRIGELGL
jgi:hypothetical protein